MATRVMTNRTDETGTTHQSTALRNSATSRAGSSYGVPMLLVRECVPGKIFLAHEVPMRTAFIRTQDEALAIPWVDKLPGEKRIQFVHGQIFVVQRYLGCMLLRAHISPSDEFWTDPPDQQQARLKSLR
jgi:hypothetical protein